MSDKKEKKVKKKKVKSEVVKSESTSSNLPALYRPFFIDDMVGQDNLVAAVKGWAKTGKWPSTILIEGNTGSGKTTAARIIATIVNCEKGTGCGECRSCKLSRSRSHPDLNEYNMAEVGKVEDTRNLIQITKFAPRYKKRIYLLDEAHAMSKAAASALLVPTEEPPPHVMWIFCTTDAHKLLDTIRNRCITLSIKPVPVKMIQKRLQEIVVAEGVKVTDKNKKRIQLALKTIANFSDGQLRKGISQLQAVLGLVESGQKFDAETVIRAYAQSGEIDIEIEAVRLMGSMVCYDLAGTLKYCQTSDSPRTLLYKLRTLVQYMIGKNLDTNKYTPYIGKTFDKLLANMKKDKEKSSQLKKGYNLMHFVAIQHALNEVEWRWNQCSIPENVLLQTALARVVANDYKFTDGD